MPPTCLLSHYKLSPTSKLFLSTISDRFSLWSIHFFIPIRSVCSIVFTSTEVSIVIVCKIPPTKILTSSCRLLLIMCHYKLDNNIIIYETVSMNP